MMMNLDLNLMINSAVDSQWAEDDLVPSSLMMMMMMTQPQRLQIYHLLTMSSWARLVTRLNLTHSGWLMMSWIVDFPCYCWGESEG